MLGKIYNNWLPWGRSRRRKEALETIRGQLESLGYSLEGRTDRDLEEAITRYDRPVENAMPLTGKGVYWALRRLSLDRKRPRPTPGKSRRGA